MTARLPYMHGCSACKCQWGTLEAIRLHDCEHACKDWHVELMPVGSGLTWMEREALATILGASQ